MRGLDCPGSDAPQILKWLPQKPHQETSAVSSLPSQRTNCLQSSASHTDDTKNVRLSDVDSRAFTTRKEAQDVGFGMLTEPFTLEALVSSSTEDSNSCLPSPSDSMQSLSLVHQISPARQIRSFYVEHYLLSVASIFTICEGPDDPFGTALLPYVSTEGPLAQALSSVASLHLSNSHHDEPDTHFAVAIRSQTIAQVRRQIISSTDNQETVVTCLMLAATEVRVHNPCLDN